MPQRKCLLPKTDQHPVEVVGARVVSADNDGNIALFHRLSEREPITESARCNREKCRGTGLSIGPDRHTTYPTLVARWIADLSTRQPRGRHRIGAHWFLKIHCSV